MKSFSAIFLIFLFSTIGFSQETITIKLIVDTANFDPDDLPASCSFEATWESGEVQRSTGNLEDFSVEATVNDTIIWEGHSSSSNQIVDIKQIRRDGGKEIFNKRSHSGSRQGNSNRETVKSKVLYSTENGEDYKYKIKFSIDNGAWHKIDPKVTVVPPR
tara:strand:- start:26 stop:505 length:480 start_codon:yes stop_codon:yes gene_type:complete